MALLVRYRIVLIAALLLALAHFAAPKPGADAKPARIHVTNRYDGAGCGDVKRVSREIAGETGKAMILCLLNFERRAHGLPPLAENYLLDRAALGHSEDMVARRYFAHESPEGVSPSQRMRATGYMPGPLGLMGENLAWGEGPYAAPAALMDDWMHSPPHREALLKPELKVVGIGIVYGDGPTRKLLHAPASTATTDFGG